MGSDEAIIAVDWLLMAFSVLTPGQRGLSHGTTTANGEGSVLCEGLRKNK